MSSVNMVLKKFGALDSALGPRPENWGKNTDRQNETNSTKYWCLKYCHRDAFP